MFNTRSFTFVRPGLNGLTWLFLTVYVSMNIPNDVNSLELILKEQRLSRSEI